VTGVGIMITELTPKRLELLSELVPEAKVFILLVNPNNPQTERMIRDMQDAARAKGVQIDVKELLERDDDFLTAALQALAQAALEAEMTETIGAAKGERTETRLAYRSGYYGRSLITRVGTLELRVPQDRDGRFSTELFQRYQRSEKALVGTLAEMYVQGVSTRKCLPLRKQGSKR
jgi:transposase-like protein